MTATRDEQMIDLIKTHQADVWRFLIMLGCQPSEADDLTQEVFIGVLRKPFEDYGRASTAAYLRTAARHAFISSLRKRDAQLIPLDLDDADAVWTDTTPEDSDQRHDALRGCLGELPERAVTAINLHYRDNAEITQIAQQMATSADAVKALLARARKQLRECVERKLKLEGRA